MTGPPAGPHLSPAPPGVAGITGTVTELQKLQGRAVATRGRAETPKGAVVGGTIVFL